MGNSNLQCEINRECSIVCESCPESIGEEEEEEVRVHLEGAVEALRGRRGGREHDYSVTHIVAEVGM